MVTIAVEHVNKPSENAHCTLSVIGRIPIVREQCAMCRACIYYCENVSLK